MIHEEKICKHCNEVFKNIEGRTFSNHVKYCKFNPNYKRQKEKMAKKISEANYKFYDKKFGELVEHEVLCYRCKKLFFVEERKKMFPEKKKYYCSRSCANAREHSKETKEKIKDSVNSFCEMNGTKEKKKCGFCSELFAGRKNQKFCSPSCGVNNRYCNHLNGLEGLERERFLKRNYRAKCRFKFSLNEFPNEFDFALIEQHGWYKAKNRGDNLNGVSRDHMYSITDGYNNGINPEILSHPANCKLMVQSNNFKKGSESSITIEGLVKKIEQWNDKYNLGL